MTLQHMPTFMNVMPGETWSCIGCHKLRKKPPGPLGRPLAMDYPSQKLVILPDDKGPRMLHYASEAQPVLDKHCFGCHGSAYDDIDPCYLPKNKIMFASARSLWSVSCAGLTVTMLYLMHADGNSSHRIS